MITLNVKNDKNKLATEKAIFKFFYEVKLRKREFLNECVKYDADCASKITKIYFEIILDKFTTYPQRMEKDLIISHFLINDTYINYLDLCNVKYSEIYKHSDPYLLHLNEVESKFITVTTKINTKPLEDLNDELSEENFLIKVAKKITDFIIVNSNENKNEKYYDKLFSQFDFDMDNKFTVGELNNFLVNVEVVLQDHDLRYLFESFQIEDGRISKNYFYDYIQQYVTKNYNISANTNFVKNQNEIFREEEKIKNILNTNYFISIIKESLQILGKLFLLKFFAKYYEVSDSHFYIDSVWLEIGFKKLGYKNIPANEMGNFKFLCVKRQIAKLKTEMTINISIEKLFDCIIQEFNIAEVKAKQDAPEIIDKMSEKMLKDIDTSFMSHISSNTNKGSLSGDQSEFEFRKNFITNFEFVDHFFLDHIIKQMTSKNHNLHGERKEDNSVFNLETVSKPEWSKLAYNILLMSLIKNHEKLGLMLELDEIVNLKNIYNNLESKVFPKKRLKEKLFKSIRHDGKNLVYSEDKTEDMRTGNVNIKQLMPMTQFNINLLNIKKDTSSVSIKENFYPNEYTPSRDASMKNKQLQSAPVVNIRDTASIIPELFDLCANYLKQKYRIEKVDSKLLSSIGCCKIFKDHLQDSKLDLNKDINLTLLLSVIKATPGLSHNSYAFLEYYASLSSFKSGVNVNNVSNVNVNFFFMKLEEIILQFSKIHINK